MTDQPQPTAEATSADVNAIFGAAPPAARVPSAPADPSQKLASICDSHVSKSDNSAESSDANRTILPPAPAVDPNAIRHVEEKVKTFATPKVPVKAKTAAGINYAAAFLLFCKGMSLKEIADEFGMRYGALLDKARAEDWELLAKKQTSLVAPPPRPDIAPVSAALVEKKAAAILANREESAALATDLRKDIRKVLTAYQADNAFLRPDDILTLAKAEKLLQEISMVALGDEFVSKTPQGGAGGGGGGGMPPIVINLPAAVAAPRQPRAVVPADDTEHTAPVEEPEALEEVHIIGARDGAKDAVAAKSKRGHSVNFAALETPVPP